MEVGGAKLVAAKLLLILASTVIVGHNSQWTNDHIVLFHGSKKKKGKERKAIPVTGLGGL
jgi:hypothetical protein